MPIMSAMPADTIGSSVNKPTTRKRTRVIVDFDTPIGARKRASARVTSSCNRFAVFSPKPIKESMLMPPRCRIVGATITSAESCAAGFMEARVGNFTLESKHDTGLTEAMSDHWVEDNPCLEAYAMNVPRISCVARCSEQLQRAETRIKKWLPACGPKGVKEGALLGNWFAPLVFRFWHDRQILDAPC